MVDLDATLRIPVYQKISYAFSDIITDVSAYQVTIDGDVTQDENGDGIYDDDFRVSGSGFSIGDTNMTFGPFDTLGPRQMILRVRDVFGNTTTLPLRLDVYAPLPTIRSMSATGYLHGEIESVDAGEPVHLMRIR